MTVVKPTESHEDDEDRPHSLRMQTSRDYSATHINTPQSSFCVMWRAGPNEWEDGAEAPRTPSRPRRPSSQDDRLDLLIARIDRMLGR